MNFNGNSTIRDSTWDDTMFKTPMAAAVFIFFVVASNCANAEVGKLIDGAPEPLDRKSVV